MKKYTYLTIIIYLIAFCDITTSMAQDSTRLTIISPYDSLLVSDVKATGNMTSEALQITMKFKNTSNKHQTVHLGLGGFDDFGITTKQGKRYKVFTSENVIGNSQPNTGFQKIAMAQFGDKKLDWVTSVIQELDPGDERIFSVLIDKFDKVDSVIKNLHIRCILFVNYMHSGDKKYVIENIPIDWLPGKPKSK